MVMSRELRQWLSSAWLIMINIKQLNEKQEHALNNMTLNQLTEGLDRLNKLVNSQTWDELTKTGMNKAAEKIKKEIEKRTKVN